MSFMVDLLGLVDKAGASGVGCPLDAGEGGNKVLPE
jgi:hypothetical protein